MVLSRATEGLLLLEKVVGGRSTKTVEGYRCAPDRLEIFVGDTDTEDLGTAQVRWFLARLRSGYRPQRFGGDASLVSEKAVRNFHIVLSSFWSWLVAAGVAKGNAFRELPVPRLPLPGIEPFK